MGSPLPHPNIGLNISTCRWLMTVLDVTTPYPCHSIFIDLSTFSLNLPWIQTHAGLPQRPITSTDWDIYFNWYHHFTGRFKKRKKIYSLLKRTHVDQNWSILQEKMELLAHAHSGYKLCPARKMFWCFIPYNKFFIIIDQACSVKMAGILASFFFLRVYGPSSRSINTQKKKWANIQSCWPHACSITHMYF